MSATTSPTRFIRLRGDALGALTAAALSVPIEASYGMIAFAPLGPAYMAAGVMAALFCSIFGSFAGALAGSRPGLLAGTRPTLFLAVAVLITELSAKVQKDGAPDVGLVIALVMLTTLMAGLFQVFMSLMRIGRAFKYVPYPVLAGFVNGAALLIFIAGLKPFAGLPNTATWGEVFSLESLRPGVLAVAVFSTAIVLKPPRFIGNVPPLLASVILGTLFYYVLVLIFGTAGVSPTLGTIAAQAPNLDVLRGFVRIAEDPVLRGLVPSLVPAALSIALLATVESLLTASVVDGMLKTRHQSDRELFAQGASNIAAACFGGLPTAAGISRCAASVRGGATTAASSYFYAAFVAVSLVFIGILSYLPVAMIGGVLVAIAWMMVDDWSRRVPGQLISHQGFTRAQHRSLLANYSVMLLVVATALITNLTTAVFVGVMAAMLLFVRRNSRSIIRRELYGNAHHSLRQRSISRMRELEREGNRIVVLELEGALFFGTADQLAREVERLAAKTDYLILDFRRVTEIDVTGARILQQTAQQVASRRCHLLLAAINPEGARGRMLTASGLSGLPDPRYWFDTADAALEWAENAVLEQFELAEPQARRLDLRETQLGRGLKDEELAVLLAHVAEIVIAPNQPLFRAGDAADGLYVLVSGGVSIRVRGSHGFRRVASFAPGVVIGEMGLLDGGPRSADAIADDHSAAYRLSSADFEAIRQDNPYVAAKILFNLGVEMATRLRYTTLELQQAEGA